MSIPESSPWSWAWVRTPFWRIAGSFASWFLFSLSLSLLLQGFLSVLAIGGSCASGGPFVIEVECPDTTVLMVPAVFGGLIAVAISVIVGQGFGTSLADVAWPALFGSLGIGFILAGGPVGYGVGGMFVVMALVPLILALRVSPQRVLIGAVTANGDRFYEGEKRRTSPFGLQYPVADNPVRVRFSDIALSALLTLSAITLGMWVALGPISSNTHGAFPLLIVGAVSLALALAAAPSATRTTRPPN